MVYLANSRALAAMELLVRINSHQALEKYLIIPVDLPFQWVSAQMVKNVCHRSSSRVFYAGAQSQ
jgi:hypothetical protein